MKARYLIRVDDICENLNIKNFNKLIDLFNQHDVRPIIAVIPKNDDENLKFPNSISGASFWKIINKLEKEYKWKVGIHGYEHKYVNEESGLLDINNFSEFAGLEYNDQVLKIKKGIEIMNNHKLSTDLFIAPAHSFDNNTLIALKKSGVNSISDGFHHFPGLDKNDILWVPQQLWTFETKKTGVWTVNMHINAWCDDDFQKLKENIIKFKPFIIDYDYIIKNYQNRKMNYLDNAINIFEINKNKFISLLVCLKNFLKLQR
jgi:predicted deacetylase